MKKCSQFVVLGFGWEANVREERILLKSKYNLYHCLIFEIKCMYWKQVHQNVTNVCSFFRNKDKPPAVREDNDGHNTSNPDSDLGEGSLSVDG